MILIDTAAACQFIDNKRRFRPRRLSQSSYVIDIAGFDQACLWTGAVKPDIKQCVVTLSAC